MRMGRRQFIVTGAAALAAGALPSRAAESGANTSGSAPGAGDTLRLVRRYADAMLDHVRGAGRAKLPLFASVVDRKTYAIPDATVGDMVRARVPQENKYVANPHYDENVNQVLDALTAITGDKRYAAEGRRTMAHFLKHCRDPKYGFFAWGEHLGWDMHADGLGGFKKEDTKGAIHEFWRPWIYWDRSFEMAPAECHQFAKALWHHQLDHTPGKPLSWSRHAQIMSTAPNRRGYEFPRHGGFYISTWAHAYKHTQDPLMLTAIEAVVDYFNSVKDPNTAAIPHCSSIANWFRPESTVSLAISLTESAPLVTPALAEKMRKMADEIDAVFLKLPHDPGPGGKGLVLTARCDNLEPTSLWQVGDKWSTTEPGPLPPRHLPYTQGWVSAYVGPVPHSTMIGYCVERHRQNPAAADRYRTLILRTADDFLVSEPPTKPYEENGRKITPKVDTGTIGRVIGLLNYAHALSGEARYLERAEWYCGFGRRFWPDGQPLPVPTIPFDSRQNFYSASSRCDTLVMSMLETWLRRNRPEVKPGFRWTDI